MSKMRTSPIILTNELDALCEFYCRTMGFEATVQSPGFLGVRHPSNHEAVLSFMRPENNDPVFKGEGCWMSLEVPDVDAEFKRLKSMGAAVKPPESHPWGDRSFTLKDPIGTLLYINTPIPPAPEYAKFFKQG